MFRESRAAEQLATREAAVDHSGIGAPNQSALLRPFLQRLARTGAPEFARGDAVIVKHNPRPAAHKRRQQFQQRIILTVFNQDEIGRGEEFPFGSPAFSVRYDSAMRPDRRMQTLVRIQEDPNIGATLQEEAEFLRQLVADGVAGSCVVTEQSNPHDGPSVDGASDRLGMRGGMVAGPAHPRNPARRVRDAGATRGIVPGRFFARNLRLPSAQ